jgi:hydroxyacylglutathione hydrolase
MLVCLDPEAPKFLWMESRMRIIALKALTDNYVYLLISENAPELAVVDPGEAGPVLKYVQEYGLRLTAILNTHHHGDHTDGNRELLKYAPGIAVYGSAGDRNRIPGISVLLKEEDEITVCGVKARVLNVAGHTNTHIAYYFAADDGGGDLFSGDTIFGGTIGNIFEGSIDKMFESIQKIRALPRFTRIWCSHEYTLQYVRESARLEPGNARLAMRLKALEAAARSGKPSVPLSLQEECETNPFLRYDDPELVAHLSTAPGFPTFRYLCEIT